MVLGIEPLTTELLDRHMLGMLSLGPQRFGRLPLEQGQPLAILGDEWLMRNVARHLAGKFGHALKLMFILIAVARFRAAGAKDDDHHVTLSRL